MTFDTIFTGRLATALKVNGIDTLEKLVSKTRKELKSMKSIGYGSIVEIQNRLMDNGLSLKFDHDDANISFSDNNKLVYVTNGGKTLVYSLIEKEEFADMIWNKIDNV